MFELSVAGKYLTPKWRQLSVSIISLISILVIALVVWLIVVFFSVTHGLEKSWIQKLVALTAPARLTPTEAYYNSYYYLIDSISAASDYTLKSIGEKWAAPASDPYDPSIDEEIPSNWPQADLNPNGQVKDLVKLAFNSIDSLKGFPDIKAADFEMTGGHLHLRLLRRQPVTTLKPAPFADQYNTAVLTQAAYLGSFDSENSLLAKAILPLTVQDASNLLSMFEIADKTYGQEGSDAITSASKELIRSRLKTFFSYAAITQLMTPANTWILPRHLLPNHGNFSGWALYKNDQLARVILPLHANDSPESLQNGTHEGYQAVKIHLEIRDNQPYLIDKNLEPQAISKYVPIALAENIPLKARVNLESIDKAHRPAEVVFTVNFNLQGTIIEGEAPLKNLMLSKVDIVQISNPNAEFLPLWVYSSLGSDLHSHSASLVLPTDPLYGEGVLLPRSFRDAGVAVGDRGHVSYAAPTASSVQEQRIPIFVAGFYEPGVIPTGGKIILVPQDVTSLIRSSINQEESALTNGINIRFHSLEQAEAVKTQLQTALKDNDIADYWKVETFRDYEFTKDIINQLQSEKNLFSLLATLIILVACSNIVSMLIILVNDKKMEIGILRSMGASSISIAIIFGTCGVVMGAVGSLIGTLAAIVTLKNLPILVNLISRLQGHEMFNPLYFGDNLPTELSLEALGFVVAATTLISLIAGLVPAVKASLMHPSTILRSE
jgi:lipoprotein-releasing system permease protein